MKEVKKFIIADIIILLIKVLGGLLCKSNTMLASSIIDLILILTVVLVWKVKDNKKYKGIISALFGFLVIISGVGIAFYSVISNVNKTSWFILLFIFLSFMIRYLVSCFQTNIAYQKKNGLLTYGQINSTLDFVIYGIILGSLILVKVSKWLSILKYGDKLGTIIISGIIIYKGIKIIINSFNYLEDKQNNNLEEIKNEISKREEVKEILKLDNNNYGGLKEFKIELILKDGISIVDVNTFVITLQDYLLKFNDVVKISLGQKKVLKKTKVKVRSKKEDARNSRSRNSKTNAKTKNSKQKNKKR